VEEGKIEWDDKVVKHLPDFKLYDPYITKHLTVRDLLCHRSGFATFDGDLLWYGSSYTREEVVQRIRHLPLKTGFRAEFGYSNIMYIAAGEVIEQVTGQTWDEYVHESFFKPLEMDESSTSVEGLKYDGSAAVPHLYGKPQQKINWDNSGPAASINSSVDDLLKWSQMWLNGGQYNGQRVLTKKTIDELWSAHTPIQVSSFDQLNGINFKAYGLGWNTFDYSGKKIVQHDGGLPGFISKICLVPDEKMAIVILANDMTWLNDALMYRIMDQHFTDSNRDWASEYLTYFRSHEARKEAAEQKLLGERKTDTQPSMKLMGEYAGKYADKMYGNATIAVDKKTLTLVLEPTKELFTAKLEHWEDDTFRFQFADEFLPPGFVNFEIDKARNKVTGFKIDLQNPDLHFSNLHFIKR